MTHKSLFYLLLSSFSTHKLIKLDKVMFRSNALILALFTNAGSILKLDVTFTIIVLYNTIYMKVCIIFIRYYIIPLCSGYKIYTGLDSIR